MKTFQQLVEAGHFQISGGSEYQWNCFGPHARFLDFSSDQFDVEMSLIFDSTNQEVFQAAIYVNDSAFRWTNPEYLEVFKQENYQREVDPRVAYDGVFFTDCDVFDDFVSKIQQSFSSGECDDSVLIPLNMTPEQEEIFAQLPEGTDIQVFILEALEEKMKNLKQKNSENWDIVFSTLAQAGIQVSIDIEHSPISEYNIQEIYNWVKSLNVPEVSLVYSDKETAKGIISFITDNDDYDLTFQYQYKNN